MFSTQHRLCTYKHAVYENTDVQTLDTGGHSLYLTQAHSFEVFHLQIFSQWLREQSKQAAHGGCVPIPSHLKPLIMVSISWPRLCLLAWTSSSILTHALTHTANNADFLSNCWWAPGQAPTTLRERRPWCVPLRSNFIKPEDRPETHGGQLDWDSFVLSWLVSKVSQRTELTLCAFFHE